MTGRLWKHRLGVAVFVALGSALPALADETWPDVSQDGTLTVRGRPYQAEPRLKEAQVEGTLQASLEDLRDTLLDASRVAEYMPYVTKATTVGEEPGGTSFVYVRLQPPVLKARDYVVKLVFDAPPTPDRLAYHWTCEADKVPREPDYIRLTTCSGSWDIRREGDHSRGVYTVAIDLAGRLPHYLADAGSRSAVQIFRAVEQEAQKRHGESLKVNAERPPTR